MNTVLTSNQSDTHVLPQYRARSRRAQIEGTANPKRRQNPWVTVLEEAEETFRIFDIDREVLYVEDGDYVGSEGCRMGISDGYFEGVEFMAVGPRRCRTRIS